MPINYFTKQKKKQRYLLLILGIVILAVFLVLKFDYFKKEKVFSPQPPQNFSNEEIKIDFSIFKNSFLKELQQFEKPALFEGRKGRENPFLPY